MIALKRLVVPLAGAILLSACGPDPQEQFAHAQAAYAAHDYRAARADLMAAIQRAPEDPAILTLLARTQVGLEDGEGAKTTLDTLARLGKPPADAAILYGDAAIFRGQFDEALQRVESANSAEAARVRGLALVARGDKAQAADAFAAGLNGAGPRSALLAAFARFQFDNGNVEDARRLSGQALAENAEELIALQVVGRIAALEGHQADALAAFERALKAYPEDKASLFGKIAALGDLRRFKEIRPLLDKAKEIDPDNPRVAFFEAMMAAQNRDWQKVRKTLQPKERELDDLPDLQLLYAQALMELGQVHQARAYLSPLLLQAPDSRPLRMMLASAQMAGDDPYGALDTMRPFAAMPDATAEELDLLSRAARAARDPQEGIYAAMALAARQDGPAEFGSRQDQAGDDTQ